MSDTAEELRPLLFSLAYRMVGSAADAEDLVQEALLRLHRARLEDAAVGSPRRWLTAVTTRLAIDHLRSARVRREAYAGTWLPEPIVIDPSPGPEEQAERAELLSIGLLVVLETLSPTERAVFVLREAFGLSHAEIAEAVGIGEGNCRQVALRARRRVDERRRRFAVSRERQEQLTERFLAACAAGDVAGVARLLAPDATAYTDGGGKALAAPQPVRGRERLARFLTGIARPERVPGGFEARPAMVNGRPGRLLIDAERRVFGALTLDVAGDEVAAVYIVVNPDKLVHLQSHGADRGAR